MSLKSCPWVNIAYNILSEILSEFKTALCMKLETWGKMERESSSVQGVWVVSNRVQVLVFWSLKRQAAGMRSRNQWTSSTITVVFSGSLILSTWTIPQYVCELMNYLGSYANTTMEQDTACVESVFGRGFVSLGVWEPKGGNWATFSPLFCVPPKCHCGGGLVRLVW